MAGVNRAAVKFPERTLFTIRHFIAGEEAKSAGDAET
jgi:hypothetical protein